MCMIIQTYIYRRLFIRTLSVKFHLLQNPILFSARMWMGCAVFCRRASGGGFYAPRVELNDAGKDPYFPDGTWCHNDGSQDYYCLQHHCLPEVRSSILLVSLV